MKKFMIFEILILSAVLSYCDDLAIMDSAIALQKHERDSAKRYDDSIDALPVVVITETIMPSKVVAGSKTIDSLQWLIDSVAFGLTRNRHFKQMMSYTVSDKIKYLRFLIRNKLESRESVQIAIGKFITIFQWEETQIYSEFMKRKGMEKALLLRNLKKRQAYKKQLLDFQLGFSEMEQPSVAKQFQNETF